MCIKSFTIFLFCNFRLSISLMCLCILIDTATGSSLPQNPTPILPTPSSIPAHHQKQWKGGCNYDCYHELGLYCGFQGFCLECAVFCTEGEDFYNKANCKQKCPGQCCFLHVTINLNDILNQI